MIDEVIKNTLNATAVQTDAARAAERARIARRLSSNIETMVKYTNAIKKHIATLTGDDFHTILHHCEMIESNGVEVINYLAECRHSFTQGKDKSGVINPTATRLMKAALEDGDIE